MPMISAAPFKMPTWNSGFSKKCSVSLSLHSFRILATVNAYVWPSPKLDALEAMRWEQHDALASFMEPCDSFITDIEGSPKTGRANGPDWIRTAYHDMATHNVADGTGGLDASIRFAEEQSRGENAGDGFQNTLDQLISFSNRHISTRGQRLRSAVDALMRLSPTNLACLNRNRTWNRTLRPSPANYQDGNDRTRRMRNTQSVAHFDTTFSEFDNNVVTEYLESTTTNPLIVAKNDTFNSDKRIFGSDGNATMLSFGNSPNLFESTCATLFARMLDTVLRGDRGDTPAARQTGPSRAPPGGRQATVIRKCSGMHLSLLPNLSSFRIQLFNVSGDNTALVRMLWDDRAGPNPDNNVELLTATPNPWGQRFEPELIPLDSAAGILSMRFTVDGNLEDQDGLGFAVEDRVVFSNSSCLTSETPPAGRFDIAVRNGFEPTRLFLEREVKDALNRTSVEETDIPRPTQPVAAGSAYSLWSIELTDDGSDEDVHDIYHWR
ncbi:hypothetical protein C8J57DRAFT_1464793 [Mycena rebaudengoi]|nr:hypothetical protein C8J57DRAFT_1464793 [Mycena rebaudengoi]